VIVYYFTNISVSLEKVDEYLDAHMMYLNEEYKKGHFIASGRKIPRTGGIILSTVKSKAILMRILEKDPFYQHELAAYNITEFFPSMTASGYEILKEVK